MLKVEQGSILLSKATVLSMLNAGRQERWSQAYVLTVRFHMPNYKCDYEKSVISDKLSNTTEHYYTFWHFLHVQENM